MIKVITELNLIGVCELDDGYEFSVRFHTSKTDLEKSGLLRRLRLQQKG
jgi:hypothetical protein